MSILKQKFNEAFHKINEKFEFYFRVLFNGGRAYLSILKKGRNRAGGRPSRRGAGRKTAPQMNSAGRKNGSEI